MANGEWRIAKGEDKMASTLVSTMGGQAQVVTFALDWLLAQGEQVDEVVALHLSPQGNERVARALDQLQAELGGHHYEFGGRVIRPFRFWLVCLCCAGVPLHDIRDEAAANAVWEAVYALLGELKGRGRQLHLCIAGGRRMIGLQAFSAATLLFGHHDRLWHMYTPAEFLARAQDGAILHASPEDGVRLISVPLVPWGAYLPGVRAMAQGTPGEVLAVHRQAMSEGERLRCQEVVDALTPRQAEVLRGIAAGQIPQDVAAAMCVQVRTVHAHTAAILDVCRSVWGLGVDRRLDYHFLREQFRHFWN